MSNSLLTMCQNVCTDAAYPLPDTIIGNTNTDVRQLLRFAQRTVNQLRRKNWVTLVKEYTFETEANQADYALPGDFDAFVLDTVWDRGDQNRMGRITPQQWQVRKSGLVTSFPFEDFRIRRSTSGGKRLHIDPTPEDVFTVAFEYRSDKPIIDTTQSQTSDDYFIKAFNADTNQTVLDDDLVELGILWRFLKRQGESYVDEFSEYQRVLNIIDANDVGLDTIDMSRRHKRGFPAVNTGQTNFGP